jgi:hypothetical protein
VSHARCADCLHYQPDRSMRNGTCRKLSPGRRGWPSTSYGGWCSRFQPAKFVNATVEAVQEDGDPGRHSRKVTFRLEAGGTTEAMFFMNDHDDSWRWAVLCEAAGFDCLTPGVLVPRPEELVGRRVALGRVFRRVEEDAIAGKPWQF